MDQSAVLEKSVGDWERLLLPSMIPLWNLRVKCGCLFRDREGLIGTYDYAFLFKPNLPFMKKERRAAPW
jgi:hypothetical protein